jgi:hypothetical protein
MTRDEFRNAIRKGQGRVIQQLRDGHGELYLDIIEHACTHHLAFDPQCEGSREDYLVEIVDYVGGLRQFRQAILDSLRTTESIWDSSQLSGLARRLSTAGDEEARKTMYTRFQSAVSRRLTFANALDILELDGKAGLHRVASAFGAECQMDSEYSPYDIRWFVNQEFGKGAIEVCLNEMAVHEPTIHSYLDRLRQLDLRRSGSPPRPSNKELERMTFDEIMSHSSLGASFVGFYMMHRWGELASDTELRKAASALELESNKDRFKLLIAIFREKAFPGDAAVLLDRLSEFSNDEIVSRRIEVALQIIESPIVRDAAMREIERGPNLTRGLYLLCANYKESDADLILKALPSNDADSTTIHDVGHALLDLFGEDRISDATDAFVWMWEHSPCSLCRERAFERLETIACVPDWMREEAKFDCHAALRARAKGERRSEE